MNGPMKQMFAIGPPDHSACDEIACSSRLRSNRSALYQVNGHIVTSFLLPKKNIFASSLGKNVYAFTLSQTIIYAGYQETKLCKLNDRELLHLDYT